MKIKGWVAMDDDGDVAAFARQPSPSDTSEGTFSFERFGRDREWFVDDESYGPMILPQRAVRELKVKPGECLSVEIEIRRR